MKVMNDIERALEAQRGRYEILAYMAGQARRALMARPELDVAALMELFAARVALMRDIEAGDRALAALAGPDEAQRWLNAEGAARKEELAALIRRILEDDAAVEALLAEAAREAKGSLTGLALTWRAVSGYGKGGKAAYATFIDFRK